MKKILSFIFIFVLIFGLVKIVKSAPQIEISKYVITPKEVYPGGDFSLSINLKNNSSQDKAKNVILEIKRVEGKNDLSFFYPKNKTTTRRTDELEAGKDVTLDFSFQVDKGALTGIYRLVVSISWQDEGGRNYNSEELISITISPPSIENRPLLTVNNFKTEPSEVYGGNIFDLKISIKNIGGKLAKNIKFEIKKIEGKETLQYFSPTKSGNIIYLDKIEKGELKDISMSFLVNDSIPQGNYNFILTFTYEDENRINYDGSEIIGIFVQEKKEKAEINIISYKLSEDKIIPGKDFVLKLNIENSGFLDAKNIRIYPSNIEGESSLKYFSIKGEGMLSLNSLKSEESYSYDFYFYVDKDAPGKLYTITFKIEYDDIKNNSYSKTKNIGVLIVTDSPNLILSTYNTDKEKILPGDSFNLKLFFENIGGFDAKDVSVKIENVENSNTLSPFSIISGSTTLFINEIKVNEKKDFSFSIKVNDDCEDNKVYNINFSINYKDITSKNYSKNEKVGIYISQKEKSDEPNLIIKNVSFEPKVLIPDSSFKLNFLISNNGGKIAKNSKIEFSGVGNSSDLYPFSLIDTGSLIYIGNIKIDEEKRVTLNLNISKDAKDGVYNLVFKIYYENDKNFSDTQKIGVTIQKGEPSKNLNIILSSYIITPDILKPGDNFEIDYTLTNTSKDTAYNITHKIERVENSNTLYPFSPVSMSNINSTRIIQGFNSISSNFKFIISPEAESGNYNLIFAISYEDASGNSYLQTSTVGVMVLRKPVISIFNLVYPDVINIGEKFNISCEIANLGKFPVNGVLVSLEGASTKGVDRFIGTLDPGISEIYEAEISFDNSNEYNLTLKVQYVDDSNNINIEKRDFKIKVIEGSSEEKEPKRLTLWQRIWRFILSIFGIGK
ncbi:MAG: COG1361 S-layer family protein [Caldisericia bacterium]